VASKQEGGAAHHSACHRHAHALEICHQNSEHQTPNMAWYWLFFRARYSEQRMQKIHRTKKQHHDRMSYWGLSAAAVERHVGLVELHCSASQPKHLVVVPGADCCSLLIFSNPLKFSKSSQIGVAVFAHWRAGIADCVHEYRVPEDLMNSLAAHALLTCCLYRGATTKGLKICGTPQMVELAVQEPVVQEAEDVLPEAVVEQVEKEVRVEQEVHSSRD